MSYLFEFTVPGDERLYARVKAEIGEEQPKGLIVHLIHKSEGGLRHIGLWESREDWERFRDERLEPGLMRVFGVADVTGLPPRPEERELALVDAMRAG